MNGYEITTNNTTIKVINAAIAHRSRPNREDFWFMVGWYNGGRQI
jgi:hypothetical protein